MGSSASTVCPICITLMSISSASAAMLSSFSSASISLRAASASHSCPSHQRRQQCRRPSRQRQYRSVPHLHHTHVHLISVGSNVVVLLISVNIAPCRICITLMFISSASAAMSSSFSSASAAMSSSFSSPCRIICTCHSAPRHQPHFSQPFSSLSSPPIHIPLCLFRVCGIIFLLLAPSPICERLYEISCRLPIEVG